jgi:hypothetical protein
MHVPIYTHLYRYPCAQGLVLGLLAWSNPCCSHVIGVAQPVCELGFDVLAQLAYTTVVVMGFTPTDLGSAFATDPVTLQLSTL